MHWNDLRDTPLRVANKVGHAWGVRMGCRLQRYTYSHVNIPLIIHDQRDA